MKNLAMALLFLLIGSQAQAATIFCRPTGSLRSLTINEKKMTVTFQNRSESVDKTIVKMVPRYIETGRGLWQTTYILDSKYDLVLDFESEAKHGMAKLIDRASQELRMEYPYCQY